MTTCANRMQWHRFIIIKITGGNMPSGMLIIGTALLALGICNSWAAPRQPAEEPLLDWTFWQKYRHTVVHPAGVIKPEDLERARQNIARYGWAKAYVSSLEKIASAHLQRLNEDYIRHMIPADTPGDTLFTPCPACRDLGKPAHPHGNYQWNANDPDKLICKVCGAAYPNEQYPENLVFKTKYGGGQTISFYGGQPFALFGFLTRPSFSANIRARKVGYMMRMCRDLAEAYALTGNAEYARGARLILLRFADVYPQWLVHVGYGEYADMDPHLAALNINNLPQEEITANPQGPDRRLHSGYWQAGRATGTGMEGTFVRQAVEAYEFICEAQDKGQPIFSEEEKLKIEKDLLLESSVLLVADKDVNNKSVGNATAAALVGMAVGHPLLVRFGLDVFLKTVDGWFLADGGTSESYSYALMTLGGIEALGQAFRGYSDPPGFQDAAGKRLEKIDLYHDTAYKRVWEAMFNGLQGDLYYPPLADGHRTSALGAHFIELMAANYPENPQYLALLKEVAGPDLSGGDRATAIYLRRPGLENVSTPPLTLPDIVFPVLQFGYLRSGDTGRDSCLILSASDWGGHHHYDSLNLYYWQQGKELLSDLGYLWDHPQSHMTRRTFAHNLVMIDGLEQRGPGRGGKFLLFAPYAPIKMMEAESQAYPQATLYRRTVAQVEHAPKRQYILDIFRVHGGQRHDYVFHGPNNTYTVDMPAPTEGDTHAPRKVRFCIRLGLQQPGAEIYVDDVSLVGPEGEIVRNSSATEIDANGKLVGWGVYQGDGTKEFGQAKTGRTDDACAYLKALQPGKEMMNVALIIGDSDGYIGPNAYEGVWGGHYKISFWLRGKATAVPVSVLYWPNNPQDPNDRAYVRIKGLEAVTATEQWTKYSGEFVLGSSEELKNIRRSRNVGPWRITWKIDEQWLFTALWNNEEGFESLIGEGWGQRDYRNSDVGAILPYIVRRHPNEKAPTVFATIFEGHAPGEQLVRSLRALPVPEEQSAKTVALRVETINGPDYFISCLEPQPLSLATPEGTLRFTGRFAAVSIRGGKIAAATIAEGSHLELNGQTIKSPGMQGGK